MAVLCGMSTIQYSARSAGFFKLNDLHISTSLSSVMTDIVDWSSLSASALCAVCRELAFDVAENLRRFLVRSVQARGMTWNWFQRVDIPYMDFRLSIVTAELCRPEVARRGKNRFFCVWKNDTLQENVQNSVLKGFVATAIDVLCSNFVKFGRRKYITACTLWFIKTWQ